MAIKPKCDKCKKELKEFGGILLGPPKKNMVRKFHLCQKCYREISHGIGNESKKFWAGGFLYSQEANSVLLHKRDTRAKVNPGQWAFFGGLSEGEETPKQTFIREMQEELTIKIPEVEIKTLCDYFNEELQTYRYVFFVESSLKKSEMRLTEGADFDWVPLDEVFGYNLTEKTRHDLKTFRNV